MDSRTQMAEGRRQNTEGMMCQIVEGGYRCSLPAVAGLMARDEHGEACIVHVCAAHFHEAQEPHPVTLYMSTSLQGADHE